MHHHAGWYFFTVSRCNWKSCTKHTTIEDGAGATCKVERPERTSEGIQYRFDAVLVRGKPGSVVVSSVLEVWDTHKTSKEKKQYCLDQGNNFGEFDAAAVLDAHQSALENKTYELKNLAIRYFECEDWACLKKQVVIREEKERLLAIAVAEEEITVVQQARLLQQSQTVQRQQREFNNNQFYNETCAGEETRILQV